MSAKLFAYLGGVEEMEEMKYARCKSPTDVVVYSARGGSRIFRRGGLTTARGNGVCPLPRKAEKFLPLLFVTKN